MSRLPGCDYVTCHVHSPRDEEVPPSGLPHVCASALQQLCNHYINQCCCSTFETRNRTHLAWFSSEREVTMRSTFDMLILDSRNVLQRTVAHILLLMWHCCGTAVVNKSTWRRRAYPFKIIVCCTRSCNLVLRRM